MNLYPARALFDHLMWLLCDVDDCCTCDGSMDRMLMTVGENAFLVTLFHYLVILIKLLTPPSLPLNEMPFLNKKYYDDLMWICFSNES